MDFYKGVVLLESLSDLTPLSMVEVVQTEKLIEPYVTNEQPSTWTWLHVRVEPEKIDLAASAFSLALRPRAWYCNLCRPYDYLLIFPGRIFRASSEFMTVWQEAIAHGQSIGVPYEQLMPLSKVLRCE